MKKEALLAVMAISIMISSNSCSDWQNLATTEFGNENLQKACENSKGTYNSDSKRCVCNNITCDDGVICVKNDNNQNEYICAGRTGDSFEKMCVSSGGIASSNGIQCLCNGEICEEGIVCIKSLNDTVSCANHFNKCNIKNDGKYLCRNGLIYSCEPNKDNVCLYLNTEIEDEDVDICTKSGISCIWHPISSCIADCNEESECENEIDNINLCEKDGVTCSDDKDYILACKNNKLERKYCQYGCYINDDGNAVCSDADEGSKCCGEYNNVMEFDASHKWVEVMQCKIPQKCYDSDGGTGCYECETDTTACGTIMVNDYEHEIVQKCVDKKYNQLTDCDVNSCIPPTYNEAAHCGECKNGDQKCENEPDEVNHTQIGYKYTCNNGQWNKVVCDSNNSCNADNTDCGVCRNDVENTCIEDDNGVGYIYFCKNGQFQLIDSNNKCADNASCKINDDLIKCNEECDCGDVKCNKGQYCKNGQECIDERVVDEYKKYWSCGQCKNDLNGKSQNEPLSLFYCNTDEGQYDCHGRALSHIDYTLISSCISVGNKTFIKCIQDSFEVACGVASCESVVADNCNTAVDDCYKLQVNVKNYTECGFSTNTDPNLNFNYQATYANCQKGECEKYPKCNSCKEICNYVSGECLNGNEYDYVAIEYDENKFYIRCLSDKCQCGSDTCIKGQYCKDGTKCAEATEAEASGKKYYEPITSVHYVCNAYQGKCDDYMELYTHCVAMSSSELTSCTKACELKNDPVQCNDYCSSAAKTFCTGTCEKDKIDECTQDCADADFVSCKHACESKDDKNKCAQYCNDTYIVNNEICLNDARKRNTVPTIACDYSEDNTNLKKCDYQCSFGRIVPFDSTSCQKD